MSSEERGDDSRIVVKKYANRRLYNTATSSYVTLDHLARLTQEGVDFVVYDAKSGDDITRSVLTQIIVEEEAKGENLLPIAFLRQLITFYGDNMRWMVPQYLEHMIQNFAENQDRMRGAMQDAMGNLFPFNNLEDMRKQNMAFFEQAMRVWSPFAAGQKAASPSRSPAQSSGQPPATPPRPPAYTAEPPKAAPSQVELDRLQAEVKSLKAKLADATTPPAAANIQPPAAAESKPVPPVAKPPAASPPAANPVAKPPAAEAPAPVPQAAAPATPKAEPAAAPAPAEAAAKPAPKPAPKAAPVRAAKAAPARAPAARRSTAATRRAPKPAASKSDDTKKN